MQVFHREKNLGQAREACPVCRHTELVDGKVRGPGLVYFVSKKTKFWTLKPGFVDTEARMCARFGAIAWFGDSAKLAALRVPLPPADSEPEK